MAARRSLGLAVALALVAVACAGDPPDAGSTAAGPDALASLGVIARDTLVRTTTPTYRDGQDGEALAVGNTVKTSDTGFAELSYFDGSFTRVDRGAEYTLVALERTDSTRTVRANLAAGRSWNRVQRAAGTNDVFEVDTPVAAAAVRGTAFTIDCSPADRCIFSVVEGTVVVTPPGRDAITLVAPAELTITKTSSPTITRRTVELAELLADPFTQTNLGLDVAKNLPAITTTTAATTTTTTTTTTAAPATTLPPPVPPTTVPPPPTTVGPSNDLTGTWNVEFADLRITDERGCFAGTTLTADTTSFTFTPPPACGVRPTTWRLPASTGIACQSASCTTSEEIWSGQPTFTRLSPTTLSVSSPGPTQPSFGPAVDGLGTARQSADGNTVTYTVYYGQWLLGGVQLVQILATIVLTRAG